MDYRTAEPIANATLYLQTLPTFYVTVPGGTVQSGVLQDGRYFGWSFMNDAPVRAQPAPGTRPAVSGCMRRGAVGAAHRRS